MSAELILKNADVITMDQAYPMAELVAIKGNKVLAVADKGAFDQLKGTKTRVIDCQGRVIAPGFIDAHCHLFSFLRKLLSLDLSPAKVSSIGEIKMLLRQQAEQLPSGSWIIGTDYNEFYLAEKRHPNRHDLDEAAPNHPIVLIHRSRHACVLNSLALSLAGITPETPEPPGALIDREPESGQPSGLLFEMVGYISERVLPPFSAEELDRALTLANRYLLSMGITSIGEASATNDIGRWQSLKGFTESDRLKCRVFMMPGPTALDQFQRAGLGFGSGDNHLRLGSVKLMLTQTKGLAEVREQAFAAHRAGFQLALHCIEEEMVEAAIPILEEINKEQPVAQRRHRLEHCSECPPHLLERLARVGAVVVTQPPFIYYSGERYLAIVPPDKLSWLYRIGSFFARGLIVAGSSDLPVVEANPLVGIYAAVTRRAQSGQELSTREAISPGQALQMYTTNAAYASFEEKIKGRLAPGMLADMVILSENPLKSPPEQIKDIRVQMTIIDGKIVWEI